MVHNVQRVLITLMLILAVAVFAGYPQQAHSLSKPAKVAGLKVTAYTINSVTLNWNAAKYASSYTVYRAESEHGQYKSIRKVKAVKYTDKNLQTGKEYWYKVAAVNKKGYGKKSSKVAATPALASPVIKVTSSSDGVKIEVEKVKGANGYMFYRDDQLLKTQGKTTYTDTDAEVNLYHSYTVVAYRGTGESQILSAPSNPVKGMKEQWEVKLKKYGQVPHLVKGDDFNIAGVINSNLELKRVVIGVVNKDTGKWVGDKYSKKKIKNNKFNLSTAQSSMPFTSLKKGIYYFRVIAYSPNGTEKRLKNQKFYVVGKKSNKAAQAALLWAIDVAEDNSFNYGVGAPCHRGGCYFCGTNNKKVNLAKKSSTASIRKKAKKYEKTYVCMTFVGAAYAHGAGDPELLKVCQSGGIPVSTTDSNFKYSCWTKVGKIKNLKVSDLMPGDVVIKYGPNNSGGHAAIYAGDDMVVEASREGWDAGSISYHSGFARQWQNFYNKKDKNYSKGYVMRYTGQ